MTLLYCRGILVYFLTSMEIEESFPPSLLDGFISYSSEAEKNGKIKEMTDTQIRLRRRINLYTCKG